MYEDKCILGKTIKNLNQFHLLSLIFHPMLFIKCENLKKIEFPLNSK